MQYLSSFVRDFATKTAPPSDLLKGGAKKKKFTWTAGCQSAFEQVRDDLIKAVGLGIPDKNADLVVETDASGVVFRPRESNLSANAERIKDES